MTVPYTFANQTDTIPLSELDDNFAAVGASNNVSYTPSGTGAVATTTQAKLRQTVSLWDFMTAAQIADVQAKTYTLDTSAAVTAAITYVGGQGGGVIYVPSGGYRLNTAIVCTYSGVQIVGAGGDILHNGGTDADAATKFWWFGSAGATMFTFSSPSNASGSKRSNQGLTDCELECNALAGIGLLLISVMKGTWSRLHIQNPTIAAIKVTTLADANLAEATDSQYNHFDRVSYRCIDSAATRAAHGIWLTCNTPTVTNGNTSFNTFTECFGQTSGASGDTGIGLLLEGADNNVFTRCAFYRTLGVVVAGIENQGNLNCDGNHFINCTSSGVLGIYIKGTASGYAYNPVRCCFYAMDNGNNTLYPTLDTGCRVTYQSDLGVMEHARSSLAVVADSLTQSANESANVTNESLRIYNGSSNHTVLTDGTNKWGISIDGSNGNYRVARLAGSGVVLFTNNTQTTGTLTANSLATIPVGGANTVGFNITSVANFGIFCGSGAPTLSAAQGSLYLRSDGSSTSTRLYVNTNGTTGWTNVVTAT